MLLSYIRLSFRQMVRNPFFTVINIAGLAMGFAVFIVLWQFSSRELKSDLQWQDWQRICRLGLHWQWTDDGKNWDSEDFGVTAPPLTISLESDFPEIESYARVMYQSKFDESLTGLDKTIVMSIEQPNGDHLKLREEHVVMADTNLFEFFSIPLIAGNAKQVLADGNAIAVSSAIARKYFGNENALGKMVMLNNEPFIVSGVFADFTSNTHLEFQIVLSNREWVNEWHTVRRPPSVVSYLKLKSNVNRNSFQAKTNDPVVLDRYFSEVLKFFTNAKASLIMQPVNEVAFTEKWRGDEFVPKSKSLLHIFQAMGVVVLLLAIVNYIMLNVSRLVQRQKELATRKVSGAGSFHFAGQFATESGVTFLFAVAFAFTLLQVIKIPLQEILGIQWTTVDGSTALFFSGVVMLSIFLTASYPVYLAIANKPQALFNKKVAGGRGRVNIFSLTVVQFGAAIVLIIWGFMIYKQVDFLFNKDLGFRKDNVIVVEAPTFKSASFGSDVQVFRNRIQALPHVSESTICHAVMGDPVNAIGVRRPGRDIFVALDTNGGVDETFLPFFNIPLLAGRNFTPNDSGKEIIISEGALPRLGFEKPEDAVGATLEISSADAWVPIKIVGVIKGYRMRPMLKFTGDHDSKADAGIGLIYGTRFYGALTTERWLVRLNDSNVTAVMNEIGQVYGELFEGSVFLWYFLDENVNRHYQREKVWRDQILVFSCIAIGIACLGLLGMISNKAAEKIKEIGVRKVLGAELHHIALILLGTTFKQIMLATTIGIPIAYYLTMQYLTKFSDRIELEWWYYIVPVFILVVIMLCTVATVIWKAAKCNPVDALKHE